MLKGKSRWGAPVAHQVERVPYRLRPKKQQPGFESCPWSFAACPPLHLPHLPLYLTL